MTSLALRSLLIATVLALAGCGRQEDSGPAAPVANAVPAMGVAVDAEARRRLGIALEPLQTATFTEHLEGPALVVDPRSVVAVTSALTSAQADARISGAARERAEKLYRAAASVSRDVLEAAERQQAADTAKLDVARAEVIAAFGQGAPWLNDPQGARVTALTRGAAVVVRASFPGGLPGGVPPALTLRRLGADVGKLWSTQEVWVGAADPSVPGPVLYAYLEPAGTLVAGERLTASVATGTSQSGVVVPAAAVVLAGGTAWCYRLDAEDELERRPVALSRPQGGGYFQAQGFAAGDRVVVAGAGLLLGYETSGGEEAD